MAEIVNSRGTNKFSEKKMIMKTAKHKLQRCDNLKCVTYCIILIFFF